MRKAALPEVTRILQVGGEGGGITMYREIGGLLRFRVVLTDHSLTFLDDNEGEAVLRKDSGWLPTWEVAIEYYGKWPWPMLAGIYVAPEFADRVLKAMRKALADKGRDMKSINAARWSQVLGRSVVGEG